MVCPWTARRSSQSILKEVSAGCSLEGLMLKLKLQYPGHLMRRVDSLERLWCWEGLGAGGEGDDRGWEYWMASLTRWTWVWVNSGSWWWTGRPGVLQFMGSQRVRHDWATELNWIIIHINKNTLLIHAFLSIELLICNIGTNTLETNGQHRVYKLKNKFYLTIAFIE